MGGVNTDAYKCVQGGRGGLNMSKNTHFVRMFIERLLQIENIIILVMCICKPSIDDNCANGFN